MAAEPIGEQDAPARGVRRVLNLLGPGVVTGAADDDPSTIGTFAQIGATLGYAMLWAPLLTFPLMAAVQILSARIGKGTGMGLAGVISRCYSRWLLYPAVLGLVVANTANVGADLAGIAAAINLLLPLPVPLLIVLATLAIVALQLWASYRAIARVFTVLTLFLLAYIGAAFLARPDWGAVLHATFRPALRLDAGFLTTLVAILGTAISPYLFFWQANQEVEEDRSRGRGCGTPGGRTTPAEVREAMWDTNIGMFFSNLVMYFIILTTAATLHRAGRTDIGTAAEAAAALRPLAGDAAGILWALGMVGAGFLGVPTVSGSAAYALSETFGWRSGLDERLGQARQFYAVIAASTLVGMLINFLGINVIDALYWTSVINGLIAPPLLLLMMLVANRPDVVGDRPNSRLTMALGWLATALMFGAAIALLATWHQG